MSDQATFTPPELADRWRVKASKVIAWIRSGELSAFDVSTKPGIGRPRYRVSVEAVERFEARRAAGATSTRQKKRRAYSGKKYV